MTDNEIIKALECCNSENLGCGSCSLNDLGGNCGIVLRNQCLDLIDRQKAEIERLTINMNAYGLAAKRLAEEREIIKSEARKEFAERLKEEYRKDFDSTWRSVYNPIDNLLKEMESESK